MRSKGTASVDVKNQVQQTGSELGDWPDTLRGLPRAVTRLEFGRRHDNLVGYADSDWAGEELWKAIHFRRHYSVEVVGVDVTSQLSLHRV